MKTKTTDPRAHESVPLQRFQKEHSNGGTDTFQDNRPGTVAQRELQQTMRTGASRQPNPIPRKANQTGLPDNLKSGIENLSGYAMDDVKVHYNSSKPAQLQAHAYAQGTDIHLAPGQQKHLPHEAWHVVQQKQGRVKPTMQFKGKVNINDDAGLEKEADVMGRRAENTKLDHTEGHPQLKNDSFSRSSICQLRLDEEGDTNKLKRIYNWITSQNTQPKKTDIIYYKIYNIIGFEENSEYKIEKHDQKLIFGSVRAQQGGVENILHEALQADNVVDSEHLESELLINLIEYHYTGTYYHLPTIHLEEKSNERMIINVNNQAKAGELIHEILRGWEENTTDWRGLIHTGKFLGMSQRLKEESNELKYDKVVLYYNEKNRTAILQGVKSMIDEANRNPSISGFYDKLEKGIGIAQEVDKGSYTQNIANRITNWILHIGWHKVRKMGEKKFVNQARIHVLNGIKLNPEDQLYYSGMQEILDQMNDELEELAKNKKYEKWISEQKEKIDEICELFFQQDGYLTNPSFYLNMLKEVNDEIDVEFL